MQSLELKLIGPTVMSHSCVLSRIKANDKRADKKRQKDKYRTVKREIGTDIWNESKKIVISDGKRILE
jgi:hypothetical protein